MINHCHPHESGLKSLSHHFYSSSSLTHSPHPLKSYIYLFLPKCTAVTVALIIIRFYHHVNLLNDLPASTSSLKSRTILPVHPNPSRTLLLMYHVKAYLPLFPDMNHKPQKTGPLSAPGSQSAYSNVVPSVWNSPLAHLVKILENHPRCDPSL